MSKPKWHEAWQEAFEEGMDETEAAQKKEKKAVAVHTDAQGNTRVVKTATGAEAERMIAEARAEGVEVRTNAAEVEGLLVEQSGATDVPAAVYELMSAVIGFAQELDEEWRVQNSEELPAPQSASTEFEFTIDDIERP